ncbi:hypothetical protein U1Q18_043706 [Sarracenia purpurea var. burkii]
MGRKYSVLATFCVFLYLSSAATAFNITRLLDRFPEFGTFNSLLTQTGIAQDINRRLTITVLAVDNGSIAALAAMPIDVVKRALQVHVLLDYYDVPKIESLSKKSSLIVTNLYQTSGIATYSQGFLNISHLPGDQIGFASAMKGSKPDVHLVQLVASQPYNISVLQVSGVIVTRGIDAALTPPPSAAPPTQAPGKKTPTPAPAPAKKKNIPTPAPSPDEDDDSADAPTTPEASPPADTPADAPAVSPTADAPSADDVSDKTASPPTSSAMRFTSSFFVVALLSFLAVFLHI